MSIGTILSIVSGLIGLIKMFVTYAEQKRWMDAGAAQAVLKGMQDADKAVEEARQAGDKVRADLAAHPDRVRQHDQDERPDK